MVEWSKEGNKEVTLNDLFSLINQCLKRDRGWKEYYESEMNSIVVEEKVRDHELEILSMEQRAEKLFFSKRYDDAAEEYQKIIDLTQKDESEIGWYLQRVAHCRYYGSKLDSQK